MSDTPGNQFTSDEAAAADPATAPEILNEIARKKVVRGGPSERLTKNIGFAREHVGENPSTPPETLAWLATIENDFGLVSRVLMNPSTPEYALRPFINSETGFFRGCLVENTGVGDMFILEVVHAHDADMDVVLRALRNPSLSDSAFEYLATLTTTNASVAFVAEMRKARNAR